MSGVNLGSAYGTITIGTDQAEQSVNSLADTMRKAGTAMSLGVTAPLAGIATAAVSSVRGLNARMEAFRPSRKSVFPSSTSTRASTSGCRMPETVVGLRPERRASSACEFGPRAWIRCSNSHLFFRRRSARPSFRTEAWSIPRLIFVRPLYNRRPPGRHRPRKNGAIPCTIFLQ